MKKSANTTTLLPQLSKFATPINQNIQEFIKPLIKEIEKSYQFKSDFNLLQALVYLRTEAALFENRVENHPRLSKIKKELKKLEMLSRKLLNASFNTSTQTNIYINQTQNLLASNNKTTIEKQINSWNVNDFYRNLKDFHETMLNSLEDISKDSGGKKNSSLPQYIISILTAIYNLGTDKSPDCYWNDNLNAPSYQGKFYSFLLDVNPILEKLELTLGTPLTIGKYAVEVLAHYKPDKKHISLSS